MKPKKNIITIRNWQKFKELKENQIKKDLQDNSIQENYKIFADFFAFANKVSSPFKINMHKFETIKKIKQAFSAIKKAS